MKRKITLLVAAAGSLVVALVAAGTGVSATRDSGYPPSYGSSGSAPRAAATSATVGVARSRLGRILVDGRGRTLYLFEKDKGKASTCYGSCASIWPPLTTAGKPHAVRGALGARLDTTKRTDGKLEVTYNGHPLYRHEARRHEGPGPEAVRRRVVRPLADGQEDRKRRLVAIRGSLGPAAIKGIEIAACLLPGNSLDQGVQAGPKGLKAVS